MNKQMREYYKENKDKEEFKERQKRQEEKYKKNPKNCIKIKARRLTQYIIIPKGQICQKRGCKNLAKEKHHPNYNNPLELKFLCKKCHIKEYLKCEPKGSKNEI